MKKFYAILCLAIASLTQLQAQAPQGFNYQATVRNSGGDLIINSNVYFKFNLMQGSQTSLPVFSETHYVPTDDLGQVSLVIGEGTPQNNLAYFSEIDWSLGSYFLGIELSINGTNGYVAMGTTQLLSVPYALYAENSGNSTPATPNLETVLAENNSAGQQQIKNLLDPTDGADAVTKSYADALSNSQGLMNFNGWDNYQVWQENATITLTPNSFVFVNANETTLVFPDGPDNCCFGDVIYVYVMDGDPLTPLLFNLQANGFPVAVGGGDIPLEFTSSDTIMGWFNSVGLKTIVNVGDYWMVADFQGQIITDSDIDDDGDGFTENQGDCDDNDATVYPGATEIEDGIDNDCDGDIDEGFDVDGDGYSVSQGDCDDNEANVYPGAPEIEDGIDNNCDGIIDEFIDPRDNNIYKTIVVNGNVWLAEDLRFNSENSHNPFYDDPVAGVYSDVRMYWPDDYDAIPEGWRIPTKEEWVALFNFVGGFKDNSSNAYFYAGGKLKSNNPEDWSSDCLDSNIPGTNEVNFNAISYSFRTLGASGSNTNSTDCNFDGRNQGVGWWSSTENSSFGSNRYWYYYIHLNNNYDGVTYSCSIDDDCDEILEYIAESKLGNSSDSEHSGRRMLRLIKNQ